MRGKGISSRDGQQFTRITPACAGKSRLFFCSRLNPEDHPRMCGEKRGIRLPGSLGRGSPPHVRGKDAVKRHSARGFGITPACAGKSTSALLFLSCSWDHPRMCGEKLAFSAVRVREMGSPPRMRGKGFPLLHFFVPAGITPAYAGKRAGTMTRFFTSWDHPRVCGEKCFGFVHRLAVYGSPPRMRGKVARSVFDRFPTGITPAYAGKRLYSLLVSCIHWDHPRVCGEKSFQ